MLHSLGPGRIALDSHRLHSPIVAPLVAAAGRGEPLHATITQIIEALGFHSFMYGVSMSPRPGHEAVCYVFTTLLEAWIRLYDQQGFIEHDPRLLYTFGQSAPFVWDQKSERGRSPGTDRFLASALEYGIGSGVAFALNSPRGGHAIVAFNCKQPYIDESRRYVIERLGGDLHAVATCFHDGYVQDICENNVAPAGLGKPLSDRQRDCLLHRAHDYRNADIAEKLQIAERSVEVYLSEARSKLGASSTLHAVAIALSRGLIYIGEIERFQRVRRRVVTGLGRGRKSTSRSTPQPSHLHPDSVKKPGAGSEGDSDDSSKRPGRKASDRDR